MSQLDLEIITPERVLVKEQVELLEAKSELGEFGILPEPYPVFNNSGYR